MFIVVKNVGQKDIQKTYLLARAVVKSFIANTIRKAMCQNIVQKAVPIVAELVLMSMVVINNHATKRISQGS
jgi:hypothetical protein